MGPRYPNDPGDPVLELVRKYGNLREGAECALCGRVLYQRYGTTKWVWVDTLRYSCCATVRDAIGLPVQCSDCYGLGHLGRKPCPGCEGTGEQP